MPDWSYQTLSKPALFRLPADRARRFVVSFLGRMSGLPQGWRIIDALGHMAPAECLKRDVAGVRFQSPLGLAPVIDPEGFALDAFARFGFGMLVVGPVALDEPAARPVYTRSADGAGIVSSGQQALGLDRARELSIRASGSVRLAFEILPPADAGDTFVAAGRRLIEGLGDVADVIVLSPRSGPYLASVDDAERNRILGELSRTAVDNAVPLFIGSAVDDAAVSAAPVPEGASGLCFSGRPGADSSTWCWTERDGDEVRQRLESVKAMTSPPAVIVDGGSLSPREVLELEEAGADLVLLGNGLVHTGPGLAKRSNEAFESRDQTIPMEVEGESVPHERRAWFWGGALGGSMFIGSVLAAWVALTSVLLPYDEAFLGRTRAEIDAFNPRILHFMAHDRITLAGTMISLSVLYLALSWFAMRKGHHWAQRIVAVSSVVGFATFFAFLGFGFFDPFHAFVSLILFQLVIQVIVRPLGAPRTLDACPTLDNDGAWKLSQWGQLCFVVQSVGLITAGATILVIGMTSVFVAEDVAFLGMEPEAVEAFDPELVPLIAHDRATFGGMLIAAGIALLLTTLWSFRRGDRWLWWTYLWTILPAYAMTLWIHVSIDYTDQFHLSPVYIGMALLAVGLGASGPHLLAKRS